MLAERERRKRRILDALGAIDRRIASTSAATFGGPGARQDLKTVLRFVRDTVQRSDKGLVTAAAVEAFESAAAALRSEDLALTAAQASEAADALLGACALLPGQSGRSFESEVERLVSRHARALGQKIGSVDRKLEDVEQRSTKASAEMKATASEVRQALADGAEALDSELADVRSAIAAQRTELGTVIDEGREAWTEALEAARSSFVKAEEERRAAAVADEESRAERGRELLAELEQLRVDSGQLVSNVSVNVTAGRYTKSADEQRSEADRWRRWTFLLGALAIVPAVVALVGVGGYETRALLPKLAIALVLAGLARYAASQSARHRTREERDEQVANDLSVFSAFIEALPEDEQNTERQEYARRLFRGREMPGEPAADQVTTSVPELASLVNGLSGAAGRGDGATR